MRLIYIQVPEQNRSAVFAYLEDEGIDYRALSEDSETNSAVIQFPLPTPAVEDVLNGLNAAGLEDKYTIVTSAKTVETQNFEELEDRYAEQEDKDIAPAELRTRALEMGQRTEIYYTMTLLSAVVAASGLLLDAPAVVVGSMVIAPQVGSALKTSVGTVFDDSEMIVDGLRSQVLGLLLAVAGAAVFGLAIQWLGVGPTRLPSLALEQIHQRVSPGVLSVVVAFAAGVAAAFSLATAVPTSLVGVMIAAALIPAAATVGIGIAWSVPTVAVGAAVLLVVNTAAINLTGIAGLRGLGYRPGDDSRRDTERSPGVGSLRPAMASVLVIALVLAGSGYLTVQHVAFERTATDSVEEVLSSPEYDRLVLVTVESRYGHTPVLEKPGKVTVIVKRPADTAFPDLAASLQRRLTARMNRPMAVEVEFRDTTIARPGTVKRTAA
jgi:uncharacterized hydrophobic protein (TIGR00341 family)